MLTLHFDQLMVIGLCCLPGAFIVAFLLMVIFSSQEIGALAIGGTVGVIVFIGGIAVFLVGLGQELHLRPPIPRGRGPDGSRPFIVREDSCPR